jgi:hypothetical protein
MPRRAIRNPSRNKRLGVPTPEIGAVGFQGLAGNFPTRSLPRRDAEQHLLNGTKRFIWTSGFEPFFQRMQRAPVDPILPSRGDGCGIASGGAITGPQEAEKDALSSRSGKDAGKPAPPLGEAGSPVTAAVREAAVNMTNT